MHCIKLDGVLGWVFTEKKTPEQNNQQSLHEKLAPYFPCSEVQKFHLFGPERKVFLSGRSAKNHNPTPNPRLLGALNPFSKICSINRHIVGGFMSIAKDLEKWLQRPPKKKMRNFTKPPRWNVPRAFCWSWRCVAHGPSNSECLGS